MNGRERAFATFIALLVILHFLLHLTFGLGGSAPDLLTLALLLSARRLRPAGAAALGLVLGVLEDALAVAAFGATAVTYTIVGYLGARSRELFLGESLLFVAVYLFVGKWLVDALRYVLLGAARRPDPVAQLLIDAPLAALYLAGVGVIAMLFYRTFVRGR